MCSVHYELQLLSLFHSRLYQLSSQYSCHAQKDTSTSGFPYPWLDIGLAARESFEATPCSNLLSCMEGWIPQLPNQPADVLLVAAAHIVLVDCYDCSFLLESLTETIVPVLHISSNRVLYAFPGISKVL